MIEVQNLTKYYNDFRAVDNISMTIRKGEILGLLGPNGAGKTTTLRMLTGYFRPSSGSIKIKDYYFFIKRRFYRIYPNYLFWLTISLILYFAKSTYKKGGFRTNWAFKQFTS